MRSYTFTYLLSLLLVLGFMVLFQGGRMSTPELYGLPVASIDVPLPALKAGVVYKDIVHAIQVPMEVPHLQSAHTKLQLQNHKNSRTPPACVQRTLLACAKSWQGCSYCCWNELGVHCEHRHLCKPPYAIFTAAFS